MIAVSLKDGEELVDLFLRKEADVNAKSASPHFAFYLFITNKSQISAAKQHFISQRPKTTSM